MKRGLCTCGCGKPVRNVCGHTAFENQLRHATPEQMFRIGSERGWLKDGVTVADFKKGRKKGLI